MKNTSTRVKEAVKEYLGNECIYCGEKKKDLSIHHRIPLNRGGLNTLGNFELVCCSCHLRLHAQWNKTFPIKKELKTLFCWVCSKEIKSKTNRYHPICERCDRERNKKGMQKRYAEKKGNEK